MTQIDSAKTSVPTQQRVWMTFDDGPSVKYTPPILGILRHHEIKAIFFAVGSMIERGGRVLEQVQADGHQIGNHSYSHPDFTTLTDEQMAAEILRTEDAIAKYAMPQKIFRPPYGRRNARVDAVVAKLGYRTILWDVDPKNLKWVPQWIWPIYAIYQIRLRTSSCVLLHDVFPATSQQLDRFLRHLQLIEGLVFEHPSTLRDAVNP
jgi:peptidoglycan/xylan/chitin deacetylase (PgdA/CDA1 family)